MCYLKPGPRCSASARQKLEEALASKDAVQIARARQEYMLTPDGIQELKDKGRYETAEAMEARRNELIAESKAARACLDSTRQLSQADDDTYFAPNEYEQRLLSNYYSQDADFRDSRNPDTPFDAQYHDINWYASTELAEARAGRTDYPQVYAEDKAKAYQMLRQGNPDGAQAVMNAWSAVKSRTLASQLSSEANIDQGQAHQMLMDWETGNRTNLLQQSQRAFGGISTYDPHNPSHRFLAAQYHRTQRHLQEQGIESVRVYRNRNDNPITIESGTLDESLAQGDHGAYFCDIPSERIVSLPQTGMGSVVSKEVVFTGADLQWKPTREGMDNPNGINDGYHQ